MKMITVQLSSPPTGAEAVCGFMYELDCDGPPDLDVAREEGERMLKRSLLSFLEFKGYGN